MEPPPLGMSAAELAQARAKAQAMVNSKTEAWAAADLGYGFRMATVGKRPVYDETGFHFRGFKDARGLVPRKPPEEFKRDKIEKQRALFIEKQRKAVHKLRKTQAAEDASNPPAR